MYVCIVLTFYLFIVLDFFMFLIQKRPSYCCCPFWLFEMDALWLPWLWQEDGYFLKIFFSMYYIPYLAWST